MSTINSLEFLSIKSLIPNLNLQQMCELKSLLSNNINNKKTENIKLSLINEFEKYESLKKFLPIIKNITEISVHEDFEHYYTNYLIIEFLFPKNMRFGIQISNDSDGSYIEVMIKIGPMFYLAVNTDLKYNKNTSYILLCELSEMLEWDDISKNEFSTNIREYFEWGTTVDWIKEF